MTYQFETQLMRGQASEHEMDIFFQHRFEITPATPEEQRCGIDRHFVDRETHVTNTVEYKADWTAARTHNAFIETVSIDTRTKAGWAYTSQADWLIYRVVGDCEAIYIVRLSDLRKQLNRWRRRYPTRQIPNKDYQTIGLLVPLIELEAIAMAVY
jgi:hypothetical protein